MIDKLHQGGQRLENPGKTWKSLEYAIGTWKTWKIGRKSQKPGKTWNI